MFIQAAELHAGHKLCEFTVNMRDRLNDTLAEVASLVPVAQLEGFARTRRCTGGNRRSTPAAVRSFDFDRKRRVAPRIQYFQSHYTGNRDFRRHRGASIIVICIVLNLRTCEWGTALPARLRMSCFSLFDRHSKRALMI